MSSFAYYEENNKNTDWCLNRLETDIDKINTRCFSVTLKYAAKSLKELKEAIDILP